jgi:hypothetical protein
MMGTERVPETSVSTCSHLTRLCAQEDFIELHNDMNIQVQMYVPTDSVIVTFMFNVTNLEQYGQHSCIFVTEFKEKLNCLNSLRAV